MSAVLHNGINVTRSGRQAVFPLAEHVLCRRLPIVLFTIENRSLSRDVPEGAI